MEKHRRGAYRAQITKLTNEVEDIINRHVEHPESVTKNQLTILLDRITVAQDNLTKSNAAVEPLLTPETYDQECAATLEYEDLSTIALSKLRSTINEIECSAYVTQPNTVTMSASRGNDVNFVSTAVMPNSRGTQSTVRLPKLELQQFSGELTDWRPFWEQFCTSIHENRNLSVSDKFHYLRSLLKGTAAAAIAGLQTTETCYEDAVTTLKQRFGNNELIIQEHVCKLLSVKPVNSSGDVKALRQLYDTVNSNIRGLKGLGVSSDSYCAMLCPVLLKSFPSDLALEYHRKHGLATASETESSSSAGENSTRTVATTETIQVPCSTKLSLMLQFLHTEVQCRETCLPINVDRQDQFRKGNPSVGRSFPSQKSKPYRTATALHTTTKPTCFFCDSVEHETELCKSNMSLADRKEKLKSARRCYKCTKANHMSRQCRSRVVCAKCKRRHATSMCEPQCASATSAANTQSASKTVVGLHSSTSSPSEGHIMLLQTATVWAEGDQLRQLIRCLFDGGSQRSFIRTGLAETLGLNITGEEAITITPFGGEKQTMKYKCRRVEVWLRSQYDRSMKRIEALEVPEICNPYQALPVEVMEQLQTFNLNLSDAILPNHPSPSSTIEVLVGADFYWTIVSGQTKRISDALMAVHTKFGWTLQGPVRITNCLNISAISANVRVMRAQVNEADVESNDLLKAFWETEHIGIKESHDVIDIEKDSVCQDFENSIKRQDGRYIVKLPWKDTSELEDNRQVAKKRLGKLLRDLNQNKTLLESYDAVIQGHLREGIVEKVPSTNSQSSNATYYMPHRAVIRDEKTTTKLRVVFDASSHATGCLSLNDHLHVGPNLNPDLVQVLVKFRTFLIALSADVEKAFLQIEIDKDDRDALRFLWITSTCDQTTEEFRMTRVPFGASCSPFLLAATIRHHLAEMKHTYPNTTELLDTSLYVDDFLAGADSLEEAEQLYKESTIIMSEAGMNLRKWQTNNEDLRQIFLKTDPEENNTSSLLTSVLKVLGLNWNVERDVFTFSVDDLVQYLENDNLTKRFILKAASRIFDPLGFLSPFIIKVKMIFQSLWERGLGWDDPLPKDIAEKWKAWCSDLVKLNTISIPRTIGSCQLSHIELHTFTDASQAAYGATVYIKVIQHGKTLINLLISKSRVAPLKRHSIPRLELMAALIGARLAKCVSKTFSSSMKQYFWTDSQITYYWIKGSSAERKPFVANRIMEIQQLTDPADWNFCPGELNPADLLTRGMSATQLASSCLWWNGPQFISQSSSGWPEQPSHTPPSLPVEENRTVKTLHTEIKVVPVLLKLEDYSTLHRLLKVTAWVKRFLHNAQQPFNRQSGNLTAEEITKAEIYWIRTAQQTAFADDISSIKKAVKLDRHSPLRDLRAYLDNGVLRVGGRLRHCENELLEVHPIILPAESHLSYLLILSAHQQVLHGGVRDTLVQLRQQFWICRARQIVKKVLKKCVTCRRLQGKPADEPMADLPADRINISEPFEVMGVDFAGPLYTKDRSGFNKSYIVLFTCAVTRAIHLELVSNLSAKQFLMAFRRFISRRGLCRVVYSDNATTFHRSARDLKELWSAIRHEDIQAFFANHKIQWKFIVERASWWGGFYERMVRTVKMALKKTLGTAILNFEELTTILTEVEAVVNSRPLTYVDTNPQEPEPLTPAHFLIGKRLTSLPSSRSQDPQEVTSNEFNRRWRYRQRLMDVFWRRWSTEYLAELRSAHLIRHKDSSDLKVDDIVILKQENQPRLLWKMAKIVHVFPGRDGLVRSCAIQLPNGSILKRPVQYLYPLEST